MNFEIALWIIYNLFSLMHTKGAITMGYAICRKIGNISNDCQALEQLCGRQTFYENCGQKDCREKADFDGAQTGRSSVSVILRIVWQK